MGAVKTTSKLVGNAWWDNCHALFSHPTSCFNALLQASHLYRSLDLELPMDNFETGKAQPGR